MLMIGGVSGPVYSGDNPGDASGSLSRVCTTRTEGLVDDVKCYVTSPIRWDGRDWLDFAGGVAVVAAAHHYDENVRTHFNKDSVPAATGVKSYDTQDALPAAGVFAATLLYATVTNDRDGRSESWQMLEAAGFSSATTYLLKYAAGRDRPDSTADPNRWRKGGDSFPSMHASAAFAIGTVLAESGNERYRWMRRILGYGIAGYTGYERLKHNAHWLSDTVTGAEIGISTAQFVMNRRDAPAAQGRLTWIPLDGGGMLTYNVILH